MFTDSVELTLSSGKGGAGCVGFRREKYVLQGGPTVEMVEKVAMFTLESTTTLTRWRISKGIKA